MYTNISLPDNFKNYIKRAHEVDTGPLLKQEMIENDGTEKEHETQQDFS